MPPDEEVGQPVETPPTDQEILDGWARCLRAYTKAVKQGALVKIRECQHLLAQYEEYGRPALLRLYGGEE